MIEVETIQYYRLTLTQEQAEELNDLLKHCHERKQHSTLYKLRDELQRRLP